MKLPARSLFQLCYSIFKSTSSISWDESSSSSNNINTTNSRGTGNRFSRGRGSPAARGRSNSSTSFIYLLTWILLNTNYQLTIFIIFVYSTFSLCEIDVPEEVVVEAEVVEITK